MKELIGKKIIVLSQNFKNSENEMHDPHKIKNYKLELSGEDCNNEEII